MRRVVTVGSEVGLHARPAAALVAAAARIPGPVQIGRESAPLVNAKSMLSVLTLGAAHGQRLVLEAEDAMVLETLAALIERT